MGQHALIFRGSFRRFTTVKTDQEFRALLIELAGDLILKIAANWTLINLVSLVKKSPIPMFRYLRSTPSRPSIFS
jgi:hypothetical protein